MATITGGFPERISLKSELSAMYNKGRANNKEAVPQSFSEQEVWKKLIEYSKNGYFIGASCDYSDMSNSSGNNNEQQLQMSRGGIVMKHAYSIIKVKEELNQRLILLQNPWGTVQWQGKWSINSRNWNETKYVSKFGKPNKDDSQFYMSIDEFVSEFDSIFICKIIPSNWETHEITGEWSFINSQGFETRKIHNKSPQYKVVVTEDNTKIAIILKQHKKRLNPNYYQMQRQGSGFLHPNVSSTNLQSSLYLINQKQTGNQMQNTSQKQIDQFGKTLRSRPNLQPLPSEDRKFREEMINILFQLPSIKEYLNLNFFVVNPSISNVQQKKTRQSITKVMHQIKQSQASAELQPQMPRQSGAKMSAWKQARLSTASVQINDSRIYGTIYPRQVLVMNPKFLNSASIERECILNKGVYSIVPVCLKTRAEIIKKEFQEYLNKLPASNQEQILEFLNNNQSSTQLLPNSKSSKFIQRKSVARSQRRLSGIKRNYFDNIIIPHDFECTEFTLIVYSSAHIILEPIESID
ncbi:MAG: putative Calpain-type cysteine protease ADL1 [Streblomastix strix]|uniref:Putative Calpain-type cysteine protease ADL1 n=1 Tax=Streblomastix strix TaxID=222440 RepID=A0A5J4W1I5_9EUKA|nr:MAG: putative Calpain-type cysteine protease ADL1 [Streblomastix strix]